MNGFRRYSIVMLVMAVFSFCIVTCACLTERVSAVFFIGAITYAFGVAVLLMKSGYYSNHYKRPLIYFIGIILIVGSPRVGTLLTAHEVANVYFPGLVLSLLLICYSFGQLRTSEDTLMIANDAQ